MINFVIFFLSRFRFHSVCVAEANFIVVDHENDLRYVYGVVNCKKLNLL